MSIAFAFGLAAAALLLWAAARDDRINAAQRAAAELEAALAAATEVSIAEATARDFADSDRSGYIDRTGLEGL